MKNKNNEELLAKVRDFLAKGEVEKAITELRKYYPNNKFIIEFSRKFQSYKNEKYLSLTVTETLEKKLNEITFALTEYLDELKDKPITYEFREEKEEITDKIRVTSFYNWINISRPSIAVSLLTVALCIVLTILSIVTFDNTSKLNQDSTTNIQTELQDSTTNTQVELQDSTTNTQIELQDSTANKSGKQDNTNKDKPKNLATSIKYLKNTIHIIISLMFLMVIYNAELSEKSSLIFSSPKDDKKPIIEKTQKYVNDFKKFWFITCIGWLLLYIIKLWLEDNPNLFQNFEINLNNKHFLEEIVMNCCRNVSTFGILGCFSILHFSKRAKDIWIYIALFLILFIIVEIIIVSHTSKELHIFFELFTQITFAVALCLLIHTLIQNLGNSFLTSIIVITLYIYASIQVSSVDISFGDASQELKDVQNAIDSFTIGLYLLGKTTLFLYIQWLIETGTLNLHIFRKQSLDSIREN